MKQLTYADLPTDKVLAAATNKLSDVVIIGYTKDGEEYFASSMADGASVLWLAERLKKYLLEESQ